MELGVSSSDRLSRRLWDSPAPLTAAGRLLCVVILTGICNQLVTLADLRMRDLDFMARVS
jgi:hypothetical protein